ERFRVGETLDMQPGRSQEPAERLPHRRIVVDHEHHGFGHRESSRIPGNVKWKVVPGPAFATAQIRPPWAPTIDRQIAGRGPMPRGLVVKKESKTRSRYWGSRPAPWSVTATPTMPPPSVVERSVSSREAHATPSIASAPLARRLRTTCCNCTRSP